MKILLSFIKIQEGGLNFAIFLDRLTWNYPGLCNFTRLLSLWTKTISSAKSIVIIEFDFGKSFININERNGPKIEFWGAPEMIEFW